MKTLTMEEVRVMQRRVQELSGDWLAEIEAKAMDMEAEGYEGDAHLYMIMVYMSACKHLTDQINRVMTKSGGHFIEYNPDKIGEKA